jgi:hypothetical protein
MKTHIDPVALGNMTGQILFLQELTGFVATTLGLQPAEFAARMSQVVSERIDTVPLFVDAGEGEEARCVARIILAKIVDGVK